MYLSEVLTTKRHINFWGHRSGCIMITFNVNMTTFSGGENLIGVIIGDVYPLVVNKVTPGDVINKSPFKLINIRNLNDPLEELKDSIYLGTLELIEDDVEETISVFINNFPLHVMYDPARINRITTIPTGCYQNPHPTIGGHNIRYLPLTDDEQGRIPKLINLAEGQSFQ